MNKEIPNIKFRSNHSKVKGIEIITLQNLVKRKKDLGHFPEKAHRLNFYMLIYFTEGKTEHLVDFIWYKVRKNTLLYLTKGQINAFKFNEDVRGFVIIFSEIYFKKQLNKLSKNAVMQIFTSHLFSPKIQVPIESNIPQYINLFHEEFLKENLTFNKSNILDSLYTIIFSKLEQLKKHQTIHIEEPYKLELFLKFKILLEKYYSKSRNANFYAVKMNMTYQHLNTICREVVDVTVKQFIDEFIILEAKRMLINSSIKSSELAYRIGFEETTNFVKYFKKHTGVTPNHFKKMYS